jgi:hypothetical protein
MGMTYFRGFLAAKSHLNSCSEYIGVLNASCMQIVLHETFSRNYLEGTF